MLVRLTANYCYRMQYFTGEIWSSKETNSLGKQPQRRADYEVCSLTVRDKKKKYKLSANMLFEQTWTHQMYIFSNHPS